MRQPRSALRRAISLLSVVALLATMVSAGVGPAIALTVAPRLAAAAAPALPGFLPNVTQFDIDGLLQVATLGGPGAGAHQGGTLTVNGQLITVPAELIVFLPASMLTWQELFAKAPAPYTGVATGMAMADSPQPITTYEVHVVGNRVGDQYIAGMVDIAQNGLNGGAGYINFINYATGQFEVGGLIGVQNTGAVVQLNDPAGRYGRVNGTSSPAGDPDERFTVDADNPTVAAGTGFPMCIPRSDPAVADDPLCPQSNRQFDVGGSFPNGPFIISQTMADPALLPAGGALDPRIQTPFEVGDYVSYAGNLVNTSATPITNVAGSPTYVLAHTVGNNMAIYTAAGTNPAYATIEVGLIGTGGLTVLGAGEAAIRTRFEGMTTDATRPIHLYGIDVNPDGTTSDRDWGTIGVDPGPAGGAGAVQGRWRFRPPCLAFGTVPTKPDKQCVYGPTGTFLPPTREVRAVVEGQQGQVPGTPGAVAYANGLFAGQYHAPIGEYIFPENIPGTPIVANNFEAIQFLTCGGFTSQYSVTVGQLNPWPGQTAPTCASALTAPVVNAGPDLTTASGAPVSITGTATGNPVPTVLWTTPDLPAASLNNANTLTVSFTAPAVAATTTLHFTLTGTNGVAPDGVDSMTVTVNPAGVPTVNHVTPITVASGANSSLAISGTDPNVPALTPLTFTVTQAGAPALTNILLTQNVPCVPLVTGNTCATYGFRAPVLPLGQILPTVIQISITATNTAGAVSATENTTVTVTPPLDSPTITNAEYRIGKQRLILTAGDNVATAVLRLQPYLTAGGVMFDPASIADPVFVAGGGIWTLTVVGAPQPAAGPVLFIKSNIGGTSPGHAIDRLRQ